MDLGLTDRACIVTGASRGIGRATAISLAQEGAALLLVARDEQALAEVAVAVRAAGATAVETLILDITAPDAGEIAVSACKQALGRIDVLVNNAGTSSITPLGELADEDWQQQWELSVMGPMRLMRASAPHMAEQGWGRIVNVVSSSAKRPSLRNAAYSVGKAAQLSLSRAFADSYAKQGVRVNAVTPGPATSGLWTGPDGLAAQSAAVKGTTIEEELAAAAAGVPIGRLGTPEEIANVVVFLCSEAASNVNGAAWSADGGLVAVII